ncbi:YcxB family protein [Micromonospora sp. AB353]|uniref:YcxB family protein n=1 Tax=Micromonospora sp. AB353 TaxID=3413282 RepID=UPI003C1DAD54
MQIRFAVPADPSYPARVAAALAAARLRRFGFIGAALAAIGVVGWIASQASARFASLWTALIVAGVLSMLYAPWVRWRARRRSGGYAVEGGYDIDDRNIMMRSGSESGGIAWDGVTRVTETPDFWIVYVGRMPATVIPRWLMSAEDAGRLRAFMVERQLLGDR